MQKLDECRIFARRRMFFHVMTCYCETFFSVCSSPTLHGWPLPDESQDDYRSKCAEREAKPPR